ncbi:MAG: ferritin-like domain-containing protein [Balneolales bacterium]|nr:ferritin-like domain-containing protein [Balneolales bacterium]
MKSKSKKDSAQSSREKDQPVDKGMQSSQLMHLFQAQLKDILWAEKTLFKAIPGIISMVHSVDLIEALTDHLKDTNLHLERVAEVFRVIGQKPTAVKCKAIEGLLTEARELMADNEKGPQRDAAIITAVQKIEHYEIATYGTLREFAETLGLRKAEILLEQTLEEEKAADQVLTDIAVSLVNMEAAVNTAK